jgi:hypothetical protein
LKIQSHDDNDDDDDGDGILGTSHIMWKVLQPEWWESSLVQEEKYQAGKACDRRQYYDGGDKISQNHSENT